MMQVLRLKLRATARRPGAHVLAIGILGAALSVAGTLYSLEDAILFRPLRVPNRDRIVRIEQTESGRDYPVTVSPRTVAALGLAPMNGLSGWAGVDQGQCQITVDGQVRTPTCATVTPSFFPLLGFDTRFDTTRERDQVIVSESLARELGGVGRVLGRPVLIKTFDPAALRLVDTPFVVTAVAPKGMRVPGNTDVWQLSSGGESGVSFMQLWALADAGHAVARVPPSDLARALGQTGGSATLVIRPLVDVLSPREAWPVLVILWAVGAVLAVGWVHVALLFRARLYTASSVTATKIAVGASPGALAAEAWIDAAMVSGGSWLVSLVGMCVATGYLSSVLPFTRLQDVPYSQSAALVTLGVACVGGVLHAGLGHAALRRTWTAPLAVSGRSRRSHVADALLAGSFALGIMLLYVALMVGNSYLRTYGRDFGFDTRRLFTVNVVPTPFHDWKSTAAMVDRVLRAQPEIGDVRRAVGPPFGSYQVTEHVELVTPTGTNSVVAKVRSAEPGYLGILRVAQLAGSDVGVPAGPPTAVLSALAASRLSSGVPILGQRVRIRDREFTVVGICGDFVDSRSGLREIEPQIYTSSARTYSDFVVRTIGDPERVLDRVLREVHQRESAVIVRGFTYDSLRHNLSQSEKANAQFLFMVVVCAIVTCGFGLYSGVSELLRKNTRALAIRLALGATTGQVLTGLARSLFVWVAASSVLGAALAVGIGTFVTAFVPNSGGNQIGNLAACAVVILVAAALAIVGPLRVLAKTDLAMLARTEP